jgi:tRNA-Thr(GGU) m(6)t(6)A37 methyltransferase TsaA
VENNSMQIKVIGRVESCYKDRFAVPRQSLLVEKASAFIRFEPWVQPELALERLEEFSHIWIIFGFHLNKSGRYHAKVHPPRLGGQSIGVFATRSPHRPNPLGLSLVQIKNVTDTGIEILGGDFADNTPVFDIKPYLVETEVQANANSGWSKTVSIKKYEVKFKSAEVENCLGQWSRKLNNPGLREIIFETLAHDPRPLVYRDQSKNYKDNHAFRLYDGDIHFTFENEAFVINEIKFSEK